MLGLTKAELLAYREQLLALLRSLEKLQDDSESAAATVVLDQSSVGRLSRMDAMQGQAMSQATRLRRNESLKAVRSALQRLDEGDYGLCTECDEPINPRRLDLDPAAACCITCAEALERDSG